LQIWITEVNALAMHVNKCMHEDVCTCGRDFLPVQIPGLLNPAVYLTLQRSYAK